MSYVRFIGCVDNRKNIPYYIRAVQGSRYSIQLGDLSRDTYGFMGEVNPDCHKAITGEADNYNGFDRYYWRNIEHFLGDYGLYQIPNFPEIFFIRGGISINKLCKINSWSEEEELSYKQLKSAVELYTKVKPAYVISHECPYEIADYFGQAVKTRTNMALQAMFDEHRPSYWIFSGYRKARRIGWKGCSFVCLNKVPSVGSYLDFPALKKATYRSDLVPEHPDEWQDANPQPLEPDFDDYHEDEEGFQRDYAKWESEYEEWEEQLFAVESNWHLWLAPKKRRCKGDLDLQDHNDPSNPFELEIGGGG